jgi:hypothetical protein
MRRLTTCLLALFGMTLAACGNGRGGPGYVGSPARVECAPFARALTGLSLSGSAADWWHQADGRYTRTQRPEVGSVLVFRRSGRLPSGHVAVVSKVLSGRQITVTQANWVHHRVTEDQPVIDVSEKGNWGEVRVWWPPTRAMGTAEYSTFGFIRPDHPVSRDRLVAATPAAVRIAERDR